jgi:ketosteroid isomerase-like protein
MNATLDAVLAEYARRTNTHRFDQVAPLLADDAVYWFSDGSYCGLGPIRQAFERTWALIQDEHYAIGDVEWLTVDSRSATCIYSFHWRGRIDGTLHEGRGRGTSVFRKFGEQWLVAHEHLSRWPE